MSEPADRPDLRKLAQDWIALCQSELAALSCDREAQEAFQQVLALWAGAAGAMLRAAPRPAYDPAGFSPWPDASNWPRAEYPHGPRADTSHSPRADTSHGPRADAPPRPAPAGPASEPRDAEIERLARRIAALEAKLAARDPAGKPPRKRARKSPGRNPMGQEPLDGESLASESLASEPLGSEPLASKSGAGGGVSRPVGGAGRGGRRSKGKTTGKTAGKSAGNTAGDAERGGG